MRLPCSTYGIFWSVNGKDWYAGTGLYKESIGAVYFDDEKFIALPYDHTNTVGTSIDGKVWTKQSKESIGLALRAAYGNGKHVCIVYPRTGGTDRTVAYYSSNGIDWMEGATFYGYAGTSLFYTEKYDVFFYATNDKCYCSQNGKDWSAMVVIGELAGGYNKAHTISINNRSILVVGNRYVEFKELKILPEIENHFIKVLK